MVMERCRLWVLLVLSLLHLASSREIEATHEWQVVGENDTVAAGMHVRMDLSTGEKWVKLMPDDGGVQSSEATIEPSGALQVMKEKSDYDYIRMHETLQKLPPDEKERMGGIPEIPEKGGWASLTDAQRQLVEDRLAEIWEQRQEELRALSEDELADLPQLLKDRISSIRAYLDHEPVDDLVATLEDLEFHLTDIDMARDFHTLGGWPMLVSLLCDEVHGTNETLLSDAIAVQTAAAWAMGTAVKNTGEFVPFAVEDVWIGTEKTNAVLLLLNQLEKLRNSDDTSSAWRKKEKKIIYGLSAILRGNRLAQVHFTDAHGPAVLHGNLGKLLHDGSSHGVAQSQRVLSLVADILDDVRLHPAVESADERIVASYTSEDWCLIAAEALRSGGQSQRIEALRVVHGLAIGCRGVWDDRVVKVDIGAVAQELASVDHLDAGITGELLLLVDEE